MAVAVRTDRHVWQYIAQLAEAAVLGAEVVAPLADAVGLVDGDVSGVGLDHERHERRREQTLGCNEKDLEFARGDAVADLVELVDVHLAEHGGRGDAGESQAGDLVLHQRDQGRDDEGEATGDERRHLVAEALAATGGEDGE